MHHGTTSQCLCKCSAGGQRSAGGYGRRPCPLSTDQRLIVLPLSPPRCVYQALILCKATSKERVEVGREMPKEHHMTSARGGEQLPDSNFSYNLEYLSLAHVLNHIPRD